jgi:Spy/CpxP family protein refolding chaperone
MRVLKHIALAATIFMAGTAAAQPPPPGEGGPMREQIREKIKTMKIWKLTEEVGLTPEQSEKFFPVYNKHQKAIEEIETERNQLINRLERTTNSAEASDKEITELVNKLDGIPEKMMAEKNRFVKEVGAILPLRQQARLIVFEERFKQRLQEFVRDIRREGRGRRLDD